jgi:hypothetical protein
MPNAPIGSQGPRTTGLPSDNSTDSTTHADAPLRDTGSTGEPGRVARTMDGFRNAGLDADFGSLLGNEARPQARVTDLRNAPGLLNGSVVLPRAGDDHPAVGQVQGALQTIAQKTGNQDLHVPRTGSWDTATSEAVKTFQKSQGLTADGLVGPRTAAALDKALNQGRANNVLVGRLETPVSNQAKIDPTAVGKSAEMLIEKYANNYGVPDAWFNVDPNHALPANVRLGGLKGAWKCNLLAGNAMRAAGFEPPYYGNRGKGEYPNANQFYKWSDKYAEKYGNKVHFKMVSEVAVESLDSEQRAAQIAEFMKQVKPGDLVMSDHRGDGVADGGHTRIATTGYDSETKSFEAAQASSSDGRIKNTTMSNFTGEEHIWILRPNRLADD